MLKALVLVALTATAVTASAIRVASLDRKGNDNPEFGVVAPLYRCGGPATLVEIRISGCSGRCGLIPGQSYLVEKDFTLVSPAPSLTLKIEICPDPNYCVTILETKLDDSSTEPGIVHTTKFSIVIDPILSGETVALRSWIIRSDDLVPQVCVVADVDVLHRVCPE